MEIFVGKVVRSRCACACCVVWGDEKNEIEARVGLLYVKRMRGIVVMGVVWMFPRSTSRRYLRLPASVV